MPYSKFTMCLRKKIASAEYQRKNSIHPNRPRFQALFFVILLISTFKYLYLLIQGQSQFIMNL